jgi:uncharacterized protein (DUF58 family)
MTVRDPGPRLLDAELLAGLRGLQLRRRRSAGGAEGMHAGARGGQGEDFFQHRAYVPGEDLRAVDFRASARSGHLLVKELHRSLRQPLVVVVDTSASMALFGKQRCAAQLGAGLSLLALRRGDPVSVLALVGARLELAGRVLAAAQPSFALERIFSALPSQRGPGALFEALNSPVQVPLAGAHLVLVSDCYGEPGAAFTRLRQRVGALTVLHVLAPQERELPTGLAQLRDVETGEELSVDGAAREAYAQRVVDWRRSLRASVEGVGAEFREVDAAVGVAQTLKAWLG